MTVRITRLLAGAAAAVALSAPGAAHADPPCTHTVGQSATEAAKSYLDRHPDLKRELTDRAQAETPGSGKTPTEELFDYLERHPDVRNALVTLAGNCNS